jgi:hypothetical protein
MRVTYDLPIYTSNCKMTPSNAASLRFDDGYSRDPLSTGAFQRKSRLIAIRSVRYGKRHRRAENPPGQNPPFNAVSSSIELIDR